MGFRNKLRFTGSKLPEEEFQLSDLQNAAAAPACVGKESSVDHQERHSKLPKVSSTPSDLESQSPPPSDTTTKSFHHGFKKCISKLFIIKKVSSNSKTTAETDDMEPTKRYEMKEMIGRGGNGTVHLCKDHQTHRLVAVKTVKHNRSLHKQREVYILRHLGVHNNITKLLDFFQHPTKEDSMRLVIEYCNLTDLSSYMVEMGKTPISESFLWVVFRDVSEGLNFLHSRGVVHGDLKLSNVLMSRPINVRDENGDKPRFPIVKIADFGNATIKPVSNVPFSQYSTWPYCAPESSKYYGTATDVWALGCMIHVLAHRKFPRSANADIPEEEEDDYAYSDQSDAGDLEEFRKYLRAHVVTPLRLDQLMDHSYPRTKVLNWFMMRALDVNHRTRITASRLSQFLPALTEFIGHLDPNQKKYRPVLGRFDEGDGATDSSVVREVVCAVARSAKKYGEDWLFEQVVKLLPVLDTGDQVVAKQCIELLKVESGNEAELAWN